MSGSLVEHEHVNYFGAPDCNCTSLEAQNLALVGKFRAAKASERAPYKAPGFRAHRKAFVHTAEVSGGAGGMDDQSMLDRENVLLDLRCKDDVVWGVWRVVGTHTGELYGVPATGRTVDVVEVGMWRCEDGLIAEAWYFGDDYELMRQIGVSMDGA